VSSLIVVCPSILPLTKKHIYKKTIVIATAIEHFNFQRLGNIPLWFIWSLDILYRRKVNALKIFDVSE
jgi:hypothetical protein